jgi:hypothetical protein
LQSSSSVKGRSHWSDQSAERNTLLDTRLKQLILQFGNSEHPMDDRSRRPTKTQQVRRVLKGRVESALLWSINVAHALSARLEVSSDVVQVKTTGLQALCSSQELQLSRSPALWSESAPDVSLHSHNSKKLKLVMQQNQQALKMAVLGV